MSLFKKILNSNIDITIGSKAGVLPLPRVLHGSQLDKHDDQSGNSGSLRRGHVPGDFTLHHFDQKYLFMELEHRVIFLGAEDCQFEYFQRIWSTRTDLQPTMWVPHSCTAMLELSARRWVSTSRTWRSRNLTQVLAMAALAGSPPAFLTPWPLLDWLGPQNLSPFSKVNA